VYVRESFESYVIRRYVCNKRKREISLRKYRCKDIIWRDALDDRQWKFISCLYRARSNHNNFCV